MSRVLTKSQKRQKRALRNKKKTKRMERQDILGISRKKRKKYILPEFFVTLKIISIAIYPIVYFVYSPLLILCVLFTISLFYFSNLVENYHNHTFIKKNHIKINKFDSIIAVILLLITIAGSFNNLTTKKKMPMFGAFNQLKMSLENIGSCLTGKRGLFNSFGMNFGMMKPPSGMQMPSSPPSGMRPPMDFDISNLPIEMVFSSALSSICMVLVFLIPIVGGITLYLYYKKRDKFNKMMNDIVEDSFPQITDEQYFKLFTFGYEIEEVNN